MIPRVAKSSSSRRRRQQQLSIAQQKRTHPAKNLRVTMSRVTSRPVHARRFQTDASTAMSILLALRQVWFRVRRFVSAPRSVVSCAPLSLGVVVGEPLERSPGAWVALGGWCFSTTSLLGSCLGEEARRLRRLRQLVFHTRLLAPLGSIQNPPLNRFRNVRRSHEVFAV